MTEHQILRTEMPNPRRGVVGRTGTVVHYFHTDTRDYLGTETIGDDELLVEHLDPAPLCTIEVCQCTQCIQRAAAQVQQQRNDEVQSMASWQHDALKVLGEVETYARMQLNSDAMIDCEMVGRRLLEILGDRWTRQQ